MILNHFNPAEPNLHWLLSAGDLCLAIIDRSGFPPFSVRIVNRPHFGVCTGSHIDRFYAAYEEVTQKEVTSFLRNLASHPLQASVPEWMYFTDSTGKNDFILHTGAPAFLCPFRRDGDRISMLSPIADNPPIPPHRMDGWLDIAATAAKACLEDRAAKLAARPLIPPKAPRTSLGLLIPRLGEHAQTNRCSGPSIVPREEGNDRLEDL